MAEYINREDAIKALIIARGYCPCAYREILNLPAADVAPVKHGKWIMRDNQKGVCNQCNRLDDIDPIAMFCRYCGARMDGEVNAG